MSHPVGEERESSPCGPSGDHGRSGLRPRLTFTTWWPTATAMMCAFVPFDPEWAAQHGVVAGRRLVSCVLFPGVG